MIANISTTILNSTRDSGSPYLRPFLVWKYDPNWSSTFIPILVLCKNDLTHSRQIGWKPSIVRPYFNICKKKGVVYYSIICSSKFFNPWFLILLGILDVNILDKITSFVLISPREHSIYIRKFSGWHFSWFNFCSMCYCASLNDISAT